MKDETKLKISNTLKAKGIKRPDFSERTRLRNLIKNPAKKGTESNFWKGDLVGYSGIHTRIYKKLGRTSDCENCKKTGLSGRAVHWANISGKYLDDINDWKRLCVQCHWDFDKVSRAITRERNKVKSLPNLMITTDRL